MIEPARFLRALQDRGVRFFAGVPDSLLKDLCACIAETLPPHRHVTTANEGTAVALAAGHHLATGAVPAVYLQNSGLGNAVNPLLSLADPDVYGIPLLLLVGWRGEPGLPDEPQHVTQGRVMPDMLRAMELPFDVVGPGTPDCDTLLESAVASARRRGGPHVIVVRKGTFSRHESAVRREERLPLSREEAIAALLDTTTERDVVVSTTGKASRELHELRRARGEEGRADFLVVGSMGHCSQVALGVALERPGRRVFCLDGDGAALMHLGGLATIGLVRPAGFHHVLLNNGAHESVGGQSTGALGLDWPGIARSVGYRWAGRAEDPSELRRAIAGMSESPGPRFLEVRIRTGARSDLGRPRTSPRESRDRFMRSLD